MCGIFGILWHNAEAEPLRVKLSETARLLQHRGPDGTGIYAARGVGLVHTRLSLLDLNDRSNQPFWDRNQRYALIYNGEIYNFAELRAELEAEGVGFRTTSDTEILLEALLLWGVEATLPKLEGMFAFGLFDRTENSFLVARDRFGIKPLFLYDKDDIFVFASEVQALRPWIPWSADIPSISSFLYGFSGPSKGFSFYRDVRILEPGGVARVRRGETSNYSRYFAMGDFIDADEMDRLRGCGDRQLVDRVDQLLNESVKAQLVADAPVGALCSGGLDSSVLMAIASRYHTNLAIFHANVVGPVSEYEAALRLSHHLRLDLKSIEVRDQDFIDRIPEITWHFGHPFYSCPHSVPYHAVSQLVRSHGVKAVLSGEGADEYFLGYPFFAPDLRKAVRPRAMLRLIRRALRRSGDEAQYCYAGPPYIRAGDDRTVAGLVHALHNRFEVVRETCEIRDRLRSGSTDGFGHDALPSVDSLGYNLRALLHRNDTMGMAASVEGRFPFLDSRLARLAINLPRRAKLRFSLRAFEDPTHYFFENKWVLRRVGERYLPKDLFRRGKRPFPINAYAPERMKIASAYFDRSFVTDLFQLGRAELSFLLQRCPHDLKFKMLLLDVWAQVCLVGNAREPVLDKLRKHVEITNPAHSQYLC